MLKRRRGTLVVTLGTGVALALTACGGGGAGSAGDTPGASASDTQPDTRIGKQGGTFRLGIVEPVAIDPYNSQESEGMLVTKALFAGLTKVDLNNQTVPYVANAWTSDGTCTSWTFKLKGGQRFSNGETVDAQAFIRGWTRAASKDAASDVAYHMKTIAGFDELHGGSSQTFSGLSSPDPQTLVVKMGTPDCEFYKRTSHEVFSPVPTVAGAADNKTYNDMPIGNGPFKMAEPWQHDQRITLVRNDDYTAGEKARLDRVEITILASEDAAELEYKNFQNGAADWARMPPALYQQAERTYRPKGDWIKKDVFGINYLEVSVQKPPMNSVDARKAVSYAIDRDAIIKGVFQGYALKATSFLSPPFAALGVYQPGVCESCGKQDPAKAKELAAKARLNPGTDVDLIFNTGGGHEAWVQAVGAQLKDVLGLNVNLRGMPFAELLHVSSEPSRSGLRRAAWTADYPTPDNFLYSLFHTQPADSPGDNRGRYSNPQFDAVVDKARGTKDDKARADLYKQAEQIAIGQDLADIPLWYRVQFRLFNSAQFQGVNMDFSENPTLETISLK